MIEGRRTGFFWRHLVAVGGAIGVFTGIAVVLYVGLVVASGFDIGSPIMPFLVPLWAFTFSSVYTLAVVAPCCMAGEWLFGRVLKWSWPLGLVATGVLFVLWACGANAVYEKFVPVPWTNFTELHCWLAYCVTFGIYWPISRGAHRSKVESGVQRHGKL